MQQTSRRNFFKFFLFCFSFLLLFLGAKCVVSTRICGAKMERLRGVAQGRAARRGRDAEGVQEGGLGQEANPTAALLKRHVSSLQEARKSVETMIQDEDRGFPELYDLVGMSAATTMEYAIDQRPQFRLLKMIPLPETLHQMYKCNPPFPIFLI
jgi:hypothetical protein